METRALIEAWHESYRDLEDALSGVSFENLHKRLGANTISISEQVAHIASTEAQIVLQYIAGRDMNESNSPIVHEDLVYPPNFSGDPIRSNLIVMNLDDLSSELTRVHERCYEAIRDLELPADYVFDDDWSDTPLRERLQYAAYHVAYHTGQIFLTRHILGEETPDN